MDNKLIVVTSNAAGESTDYHVFITSTFAYIYAYAFMYVCMPVYVPLSIIY